MKLRTYVQGHSEIPLERQMKARLPKISNVNLRTSKDHKLQNKETNGQLLD